MSDLTQFAEHCKRMATAQHKPECRTLDWVRRDGWGRTDWVYPAPDCTGCVTDADRELFARLAAEIDAHMAPQVDLFGELGVEPGGDA